MTFALSTAARNVAAAEGKLVSVGLASGVVVHKGDIMTIAAADIATTTVGGLAYPGHPVSNADWATAGTATGDQFAGIAHEAKTATATYTPETGFLSTNSVRVDTIGEYEFDCTGFATADIGGPAYQAVDVNPHTVVNSAGTNAPPIGIVTWVNLTSSATKCRVKIDQYALGAAGRAA